MVCGKGQERGIGWRKAEDVPGDVNRLAPLQHVHNLFASPPSGELVERDDAVSVGIEDAKCL